jgi:hypothetical protein
MEENDKPHPFAPFGFTKKGTVRKRMPKEWKAREKRTQIVRQKTYTRRDIPYDFLKYHGVVFGWIRKKHGISNVDIEILLFLYGEKIFTMSKLKEYAMIYTFGRKKLVWLQEQGLIRKWRDEKDGRVFLFELTQHGKRIVNSIYKKLNGDEPLTPIDRLNDKAEGLIKTKDRAYDIVLNKMNKANAEKKQQARHPGKKVVKKKKGRRTFTPIDPVFNLVD